MLLGTIHTFEIHVLSRFDVWRFLDRSTVLKFLKQIQSSRLAKDEMQIVGNESPFPRSKSYPLTEHLADLVARGDAILDSNLGRLFWRHRVSSQSKSYALTFLRHFKTSAEAMGNARRFVMQSNVLPKTCTIGDDMVLEQLAVSIASGEAVVGFRTLNRIAGNAPPPYKPPASPPPPPSAPPPRRTWEPDPATFPSSHDPGSQAQALLAAAQSGVPFCEQCQKATK